MAEEEKEKEEEPRKMRPDDVEVQDGLREKDIVWDDIGETITTRVKYQELGWIKFAGMMIDCMEPIPGTDDDKFNIEKYLLDAAHETVKVINDQAINAAAPFKWKANFGFGLMDVGIIPKPKFGGGGKNR